MAVLEPGTRLVALLGDPVAHSRSPRMHAAAFAALGLPWAYVALRVAAADLGDAIRGLRALGFAGANVTVPHKERAFSFADHVDETARRCRAVNTLVISAEAGITAFNTDVDGVLGAFVHEGVALEGARAVVLGAGGGARGACAALVRGGAREVVILARRRDQAETIVADLNDGRGPRFATDDFDDAGLVRHLAAADVIIHATPLGMTPGHDASPLPPSVRLSPDQAVLDMVYNPAETALLRTAREAGARTVSGLLMLAYQGASAFEKWTSRAAPIDVMLRALTTD